MIHLATADVQSGMNEALPQLRLTADEEACRALMVRYQAGDGQAFEALYAALEPCIRTYCAALTGNVADIDEQVANIFMGIHFARRTFSPRARFEPWLAEVVRHTTDQSHGRTPVFASLFAARRA